MLVITPYPQNAKKHPKKQVQQVADSIKEFGMNQPIVVDKKGVIIVGHGRYDALKLLGWEIKPEWVKVVDLSEEQANAYRLADNKLNESEWDMKLVIEELKGLSLPMLDLTGFDKDLILEADEADDAIPAIPDKPRSKLGDLYELGQHRVLCGDSTKLEDVERLMDGKKADMVFTDPPYNVDYSGMQNSKKWDKIANDSMSDAEFEEFLKSIFERYNEHTKKDAAFYICHSDKASREFRNAFESVGLEWRATIIWMKNISAFNFAQYKYQHEPIFYCFRKGNTVSWYGDATNTTKWKETWDDKKIVAWFKKQQEKERISGATTVWEAKKEHGDHPTIKPIELITKAVFNSSKQDDIVLDLFLGSGSTLIASQKTGRICYGMELDCRYIDVIIERWCEYTGIRNIKKNGKDIVWTKKEEKSGQDT